MSSTAESCSAVRLCGASGVLGERGVLGKRDDRLPERFLMASYHGLRRAAVTGPGEQFPGQRVQGQFLHG